MFNRLFPNLRRRRTPCSARPVTERCERCQRAAGQQHFLLRHAFGLPPVDALDVRATSHRQRVLWGDPGVLVMTDHAAQLIRDAVFPK